MHAKKNLYRLELRSEGLNQESAASVSKVIHHVPSVLVRRGLLMVAHAKQETVHSRMPLLQAEE